LASTRPPLMPSPRPGRHGHGWDTAATGGSLAPTVAERPGQRLPPDQPLRPRRGCSAGKAWRIESEIDLSTGMPTLARSLGPASLRRGRASGREESLRRRRIRPPGSWPTSGLPASGTVPARRCGVGDRPSGCRPERRHLARAEGWHGWRGRPVIEHGWWQEVDREVTRCAC
jgi:hypothetical protein